VELAPPSLGGANSRLVTFTAASRVRRREASWPDWLLALAVALAVIGTLDFGYAPRWTFRAALYLAVLPAGLRFLVVAARSGDRRSRIGIAVLAAGLLSAAASESPWLSIVPMYYRHESVVLLAACLGMWAMVSTRNAQGKRLIEVAFLSAVGASVLVGLLQVAFGLSQGESSLRMNRATGLSLHPIYFGTLAAAAAVCLCHRLVHMNGRRAFLLRVLLGLLAAGIWVSGTRSALMALVVGSAFAARLVPWRAAFGVSLQLGAGLTAGAALADLGRRPQLTAYTNARSAGERMTVARVSGGLADRWTLWSFDLKAFLDRPLIGHGLGNHPAAIQRHYTAAFAERFETTSVLNLWTDAHNLVIELLVTVGAVGTTLAIWFLVSHWAYARGPAAWAAGAIALTWLLEPASLVTLLPAAALLGLASDPVCRIGRVARPTAVILAVATVSLPGWLLVGDALLARADGDGGGSKTIAASVLWHDPLAAEGAAVLTMQGANRGDPNAGYDSVLKWAAEMTSRDPGLAVWWAKRGRIEATVGEDRAALASFKRALELQPLCPDALLGIALLPSGIVDNETLELVTQRLGELHVEPLAANR
jgi:O-antigen ligase